ncbi:nucleolar and spindle-associated protein 1 isoform X2 [Electrophorus electricus]|uniref:nucleolar and spindle-associated protein 1 isoform X2 n=1 Tax=Electrophorus electricus TaxID=8005 RepID=UPI0015D0AFF9|nr:nucleolar and spindle-associated protein 1 isoform X2 [Electrophorus electricus]
MKMDLDALKYTELQQLAKSVGLKANMKAEKLLKALKTHFEQEDSENGNNVASGDTETPTQTAEEPIPSSAPHVTKRQNATRGKNAKRKHSNDGVTDTCPKPQERPTPDNAKATGEDSRRNSKRRKMSSVKEVVSSVSSEEPNENQAETEPTSISDASTLQSDKGVSKKAAGKIPRHEGLLKKKTTLKPITPNFKKLHEAHFSKMESIDSYVQRRNKQVEDLKNSIKELKKPPVRHASLFSPGVQERKPAPDKRRFTQVSASKAVGKDRPSVFRPTVLSTNKINVRFSQATQDNEHKRSLVKTPARMSPLFPPTPNPGRMSETCIRPETNAATVNKTPRLSAFVFGDASTTPATNKKSSFDLKASLSRPLTYKPHKGKLKPFGAMQENAALDKSQTIPSHQKNYKQHQVRTREERRVKHTVDRKQKKEKMLGARRGLLMP